MGVSRRAATHESSAAHPPKMHLHQGSLSQRHLFPKSQFNREHLFMKHYIIPSM